MPNLKKKCQQNLNDQGKSSEVIYGKKNSPTKRIPPIFKTYKNKKTKNCNNWFFKEKKLMQNIVKGSKTS